MGFEAFLGAGPIKLAGEETSPVFEFSVPEEAQEMFLRVVALWRDNEPLGGEAPTFKIRAGRGDFVSVRPDSGDVSINGGTGEVGLVRCERHQHDVFLLTISKLVENSGPWKIRITNNDAETLRFLGFSSYREPQTLQPWLVLGDPNASFSSGVLRFVGAQTHSKELRNWGTAPLTFGEPPGTLLGGDDSPVLLVSRPDRIAPHDIGQLTTSTNAVTVSRNFVHVLRSNDTFDSHGRLNIDVEPRPAPQPFNPAPGSSEFFCRRGCGCPEDLPSNSHGGPCERGTCGHSAASHHPI